MVGIEAILNAIRNLKGRPAEATAEMQEQMDALEEENSQLKAERVRVVKALEISHSEEEDQTMPDWVEATEEPPAAPPSD